GADADPAVLAGHVMLVGPGLVAHRIVAAGHPFVVIADQRRHPPAEGGAVADMVDQPGIERGPRQVSTRRVDEALRIGGPLADPGARPDAGHVLLPELPERVD